MLDAYEDDRILPNYLDEWRSKVSDSILHHLFTAASSLFSACFLMYQDQDQQYSHKITRSLFKDVVDA